jgi:glycyl-tRNA synthetase beta chain
MLKEVLRANGVVVDPAERLKIIEDGLAQGAERTGGKVVQDPELTRMVVNLNEHPSVIQGSFDPEFLKLPKEILITVMREHQKYFSLVNDRGELLPHFLAVINLDADRNGVIRQGHERVLRARLADAAFFWETDRKKKLLERRDSLRQVLFQEKLGSYFDKTERVLRLLPEISRMVVQRDPLAALAVERDLLDAGKIYKCDLVTEMVKEFTDLQGVVGGLYAQDEGYPESVWRAIYEHYQPKSTGSPSPGTPTGALLAIADRFDTICGCFSVGLVPTGSKDPFAVRRQGNGILKIVLDHRFQVSLNRLIELSLKPFSAQSRETAGELLKFFEGRLRFLLEETGYSYDCINAGLAIGFDDPLDALERIRALEQHRNADDLLAVASSFKRIKNILAQAGSSDGEVDPALMSDAAERTLWEDYLKIRPEVQEAAQGHNYDRALRAMASMRPSVDRFFDEVLVMCEDEAQKKNRLSLLGRLAQLFLSVADISEIVKERQ